MIICIKDAKTKHSLVSSFFFHSGLVLGIEPMISKHARGILYHNSTCYHPSLLNAKSENKGMLCRKSLNSSQHFYNLKQ